MSIIASMERIRTVAVSYLNTKPFLYGLFKSNSSRWLDLRLEIPSVCADVLQAGEADLGLIPVAAIPSLGPEARIVSDYCIGADGPVRTVCVYSECPIEEVTHLMLDYHSRTSVELVKILLREHWKIFPRLIPARPGYEDKIQFTRAGLIIGDRTMGMAGRYPYVYDLAEEWKKMTGLPFVFAAWVSVTGLSTELKTSLSANFVRRFDEALKLGLESLDELLCLLPQPAYEFDLRQYFTRDIQYRFDESKRKALEVFLSKVSSVQHF